MQPGDHVRVKTTAEYFGGKTGAIVKVNPIWSPTVWIVAMDNDPMAFLGSNERAFWESELEVVEG